MLTVRERECLRLVYQHLNSSQIARQLGVAPSTVDKHCESAFRKLGLASRREAALLLMQEEAPPDWISI